MRYDDDDDDDDDECNSTNIKTGNQLISYRMTWFTQSHAALTFGNPKSVACWLSIAMYNPTKPSALLFSAVVVQVGYAYAPATSNRVR